MNELNLVEGTAVEVSVKTHGILFDMDGVLISSIGSVVRCWRQWAAIYGVPNADTYEVPHGMRAIEIVRALRPDVDAEEGLRKIEDLEMEDMAGLTVLPGVKKLLESLPTERWAIVTSATQRLMLGRLKQAGLPIPTRNISGDMVERGKPDPEPYRRGAELLGLEPEDCIVLEDAPSGVGAGIAAGCRVLAVLGTHSVEELSHATWVAKSLDTVTVDSSGDGLVLRFASVR